MFSRATSNNIAPQPRHFFRPRPASQPGHFFRPRPAASDEKMPRLRGWPRTKKCLGFGAILLDIALEDTVYTLHIYIYIYIYICMCDI